MAGTPPTHDGGPREQRRDATDALRRPEEGLRPDDARPVPFPGHAAWVAGPHPLDALAGAPPSAHGASVTLENVDLWRKFHRIGTEMIITKTGRRMFPALQISATGLDPDAEYYFLLELAPTASEATPARHHRLRFSGREWVVAGRGEAQAPASSRIYVHPDSPAAGSHWMLGGARGSPEGGRRVGRKGAVVSFSKVKLTNNSLDGCGHVVLTSMHKYIPRVHIIKAQDYMSLSWGRDTLIFSFPETEFVAVTAYQNGKITKLKIDHNPFAKGFRETGMSKSKRKLEQMMMKDDEKDDEGDSTDEEMIKSPRLDHNNNGSDSGIQRNLRPHSAQSRVSGTSGPSISPASSPGGSNSSSSRVQSVLDDSAIDLQTNPRLTVYDSFPGYFPLLWASFAQQAGLQMANYSPHQQYYPTQEIVQQHLDNAALSRLALPSLHHQPLHPLALPPWKVPLYGPTNYDCFSPQAVTSPYLHQNHPLPYSNLSPFITPNIAANFERPPYLLDLSYKRA